MRALVVDDEPALVRVVAAYLEREGFDVTTAADGRAALARAREIQPDVVVLDVMMPGIDGLEVCRQLRSFSDAYVIMLTARAEEIDTLVGLSVGADDYMTKPFSSRVLVARIRSLLRRPRQGEGLSGRTGEPGEPDTSAPRRFGDLTIDLPSDRERIFERFYRADTSRTRTTAGSGIGLTIARAIVAGHGGRLTATSAGPATGATFRVELP